MIARVKFNFILLMVGTFILIYGGTVFAAQGEVLKLAFVAPPPVWGPLADQYARDVNHYLKELQIKNFGGGQLGDLRKNLAEIKMGKLDMMLCGGAVPSMAKGGEALNVLYAPYVFNSDSHMRKYFQSDLFKSMLAPVEEEGGFKFLGYVGDRSPRLISTTNRKVIKPEDMKGLKIRVPLLKPINIAMQAWGATPIPLSASELYMALKQGVVDGQDNGFDALYMAKFYEVQKYVTPIDYIRQGLIILISKATWEKLDPKEKKALLDAIGPACKWGNKENEEIMEKSIKGVREKGMIILKPDLEAFKTTAAHAINNELDGKLWPAGLYDKIRAME
jgi:TRAP-type C4-dicarboxylate transport system substrate-binding protein